MVHTRAERAAAAARLRATGMTLMQIADTMGISYSYAQDLVSDPDGAKARKRRERYGDPCAGCGRRLHGSDGYARRPGYTGYCTGCLVERDMLLVWTRDEIISTFRWFHQQTGRSPTSGDDKIMQPSQRHMFSTARIREAEALAPYTRQLPRPAVVKDMFGSWGVALDAAGLPRPRLGGAAHRDRLTPA